MNISKREKTLTIDENNQQKKLCKEHTAIIKHRKLNSTRNPHGKNKYPTNASPNYD